MTSDYYEITYTNKDTGQKSVHTFLGNQSGAHGWSERLSQENNNTPTVVEHVTNFGGDRKIVGGVGHTD